MSTVRSPFKRPLSGRDSRDSSARNASTPRPSISVIVVRSTPAPRFARTFSHAFSHARSSTSLRARVPGIVDDKQVDPEQAVADQLAAFVDGICARNPAATPAGEPDWA
jgi:hypothetical protein